MGILSMIFYQIVLTFVPDQVIYFIHTINLTRIFPLRICYCGVEWKQFFSSTTAHTIHTKLYHRRYTSRSPYYFLCSVSHCAFAPSRCLIHSFNFCLCMCYLSFSHILCILRVVYIPTFYKLVEALLFRSVFSNTYTFMYYYIYTRIHANQFVTLYMYICLYTV